MIPTCPYCQSTDVQPEGRQYRCLAAKCRMPFVPAVEADEPAKPAAKKPKGPSSKGESGAE